MIIIHILLQETFCQYGQCDRGSDAKCAVFGRDYCCAYVDIKSSDI